MTPLDSGAHFQIITTSEKLRRTFECRTKTWVPAFPGQVLIVDQPLGFAFEVAQSHLPYAPLILTAQASAEYLCDLWNTFPHSVICTDVPTAWPPEEPTVPLVFTPLSAAERRVLRACALGKSNKVIARESQTSEQTVKNQLLTVFHKLGVENRTEAALHYFGIHRPRKWIAAQTQSA